jgi:adenylate kinase
MTTTAQVDYPDGILAEGGLDVVLQLTADDEELVARLLGRAKETGRSDDNEAVIRHRLDLYRGQT